MIKCYHIFIRFTDGSWTDRLMQAHCADAAVSMARRDLPAFIYGGRHIASTATQIIC